MSALEVDAGNTLTADRNSAVEEARPGWPALAGALVLAVVGLVEHAVLVLRWFRKFVNEDQTLLWAAARSWGRLRPQQPNFWGQSYGTTLEAVPAEMLRLIGIGYPTGLPLALLGLNLASWWLPAAAAWRRGRVGVASVALAMPVLLTTEYMVTIDVYGSAAGRFLAGIGLAIVVSAPARAGPVAVAITVSGLAVLLDSSAALVAGPVCVFAILSVLMSGAGSLSRRSAVLFSGLALPAAWGLFTAWWYSAHPADSLHPAPVFDPQWAVLLDNLRHPSRHFRTFAPELVRSPGLVLALILVVAVLVVRQRRWAPSIAALVFVLVLGLMLAVPKSRDALPTVYFLASRTVLSLPLGLWFLWTLVPAPRRRAVPGLSVTIVLVVTLATTGVRFVEWEHRGGVLRAQAVAYDRYPLIATSEVIAVCDRAKRASDTRQVRVLVFQLRTFAYACAGLIGPDVTTVFPEYERRSWVLHALDDPGPSDVLFIGNRPAACDAPSADMQCEQWAPDVTVVRHRASSPLDTVRNLGIQIRPYNGEPRV